MPAPSRGPVPGGVRSPPGEVRPVRLSRGDRSSAIFLGGMTDADSKRKARARQRRRHRINRAVRKRQQKLAAEEAMVAAASSAASSVVGFPGLPSVSGELDAELVFELKASPGQACV